MADSRKQPSTPPPPTSPLPLISPLATSILEEVTRNGVLLVHDRNFPSVTSFVTGGPVAGSWWAHPKANAIYNALGELEERVLTLKLLSRKNTLVAERLWPDLVSVVAARDPWQMVRLSPDAENLLQRVDTADGPVLLDRSDTKAAEQLEQRLLVHVTEVHTESGTHRKALQTWDRWAAARAVAIASTPVKGRSRIEDTVDPLVGTQPGKLLPW